MGESDSILYVKDLTTIEQKIVRDFISTFPLATLKDEYVTPNVDDGDQKLFVFKIGKIEKKIQTSNYYQDDLGSLVNLLNYLVPIEFDIIYEESI